jgi:predicted DNA-binding protein
MPTAELEKVKSKKAYPYSFRFRPRIHGQLNHYSKSLKRNKSSLVEEALERLFDEEEQKAIELKKTTKTYSGRKRQRKHRWNTNIRRDKSPRKKRVYD